MIFPQIFEMINVGIAVLDKDLKIFKWNRWMEIHSKIPAKEIVGTSIFDHFPDLNNPRFIRNCKSVMKFGNFAFFSQKLHKYLFPFRPINTFGQDFEFMQQSCNIGPLRDENKTIQYLYIMVNDVTEVAAFEAKLIEMNTTDALTEVYNRRYFETRLNDEYARHKRYNCRLSIIMLDIDYFKNVNDTYGHQYGDYVLKTFASIISSRIRTTDIIARYGGEEFCCLLPETKLEMAEKLAEKLRLLIENYKFAFNNIEINITMSQGVAEFNKEISSPEVLVKNADTALYEAKETGRNKVVVFKN